MNGIDARRQGGKRAEHQAGHDGDEKGEAKDAGVDVDLMRARGEPADKRRQHVDCRPGEREAEDPAGDRQHRAFGQQLTDQTPASGTERGAHRQLAIAPQHARERQVGDIRARDQQNQTRRAEQDQQQLARTDGELFEQVGRFRLKAGVGAVDVGVVLLEPLTDRGHLGRRSCRRHAFLEQTKHLHVEGTATGRDPCFRIRAERAGRRRHVHVDFVRIVRHRGQDTDDGVRPVVHLENLTDNRRVSAELALPIGVAEHQHRIRTFVIIRVDKGAAHDRLDAERIEEVRRDDAGGDAIGFAATQQIEVHLMELDDAGKARELLSDSRTAR